MAKKKSHSLTERIAALINRVGQKPEPTFGDIKSDLVECLNLAETLEDGAAIRDAEAEAAVLEAALQKSNLENENLNAELKEFRAERKKQEDEKRRQDIDPIQFQILERLGSPATCDWLNLGQIARALKIPVDEAEIYIEGLEGLGLIFYHPHEPGGGGWLRTAKGNKLVVAKRWVGEEEGKKRCKHPDLLELEDAILDVLLASHPSQAPGVTSQQVWFAINTPPTSTPASEAKTEYVLRNLEKQGFAGCEDGTYGAPDEWYLTDKAKEYLAERNRL